MATRTAAGHRRSWRVWQPPTRRKIGFDTKSVRRFRDLRYIRQRIPAMRRIRRASTFAQGLRLFGWVGIGMRELAAGALGGEHPFYASPCAIALSLPVGNL